MQRYLPLLAGFVLAASLIISSCSDSSSSGTVTTVTESEPNDTSATANHLGSAGEVYSITGTIGSGTDLDFFSVNALTGTVITIDLTNLPADYDVELYDSVGNLVDLSINGLTADEQIVFTSPTDELYYILVSGFNGAFDVTQSYQLRVAVPQGGALDPDFGVGGVIRVNPDPGPDDAFNDGVIDVANGFMYLVGGVGDGTGSNFQWRIEKRLLSDGSLVPGFGVGGVVLSDPNPSTNGVEEATAIAFDVANDRMYVVGGEISVVPDVNWRFEKRLLSTGALDPTFGPGLDGLGFATTQDASWRIEKRTK